MNREKLLAALEALRAYAMPSEFKENPEYVLDHARYHRIGETGRGGGSKPLGENDVKGAYVKAHWNINQQGYSIKPPHTSSTLGHVQAVHLSGPDGVRFEVNESNRLRHLATRTPDKPNGVKNPHAFVHGVVQRLGITEDDIPKGAIPMGYSPTMGHFFQVDKGEDGKPKPGPAVHHVKDVFMLPPHPDATKAHQDKQEAAKAAGENMFSWNSKNKGPIGRVWVVPHDAPKEAKNE